MKRFDSLAGHVRQYFRPDGQAVSLLQADDGYCEVAIRIRLLGGGWDTLVLAGYLDFLEALRDAMALLVMPERQFNWAADRAAKKLDWTEEV